MFNLLMQINLYSPMLRVYLPARRSLNDESLYLHRSIEHSQ